MPDQISLLINDQTVEIYHLLASDLSPNMQDSSLFDVDYNIKMDPKILSEEGKSLAEYGFSCSVTNSKENDWEVTSEMTEDRPEVLCKYQKNIKYFGS